MPVVRTNLAVTQFFLCRMHLVVIAYWKLMTYHLQGTHCSVTGCFILFVCVNALCRPGCSHLDPVAEIVKEAGVEHIFAYLTTFSGSIDGAVVQLMVSHSSRYYEDIYRTSPVWTEGDMLNDYYYGFEYYLDAPFLLCNNTENSVSV